MKEDIFLFRKQEKKEKKRIKYIGNSMEREIEAEIALEEVNVLRKGCEKKKHIEKITHVAVLIRCLFGREVKNKYRTLN